MLNFKFFIIFLFCSSFSFSAMLDPSESPHGPNRLPRRGVSSPKCLFGPNSAEEPKRLPDDLPVSPANTSSGYATDSNGSAASGSGASSPAPVAFIAQAVSVQATVPQLLGAQAMPLQTIPLQVPTVRVRNVIYPPSRSISALALPLNSGRNVLYPPSILRTSPALSEEILLSKTAQMTSYADIFSFHEVKIIQNIQKLSQRKRTLVNALKAHQKQSLKTITVPQDRQEASRLFDNLVTLVQNEQDSYDDKRTTIVRKLKTLMPAPKFKSLTETLKELEKKCKTSVKIAAHYAKLVSAPDQSSMKKLAAREKLCSNSLSYLTLIDLESRAQTEAFL